MAMLHLACDFWWFPDFNNGFTTQRAQSTFIYTVEFLIGVCPERAMLLTTHSL